MNLPTRRRNMRGAHLCLVMDNVQNTNGLGRRRVDGEIDQDLGVPAHDTAHQRAKWFAETGARITAIRSPGRSTGTGPERFQPLKNLGLGEPKRANPDEIEADRNGIEWIDIQSRGVRGTRELTKRLDQLRPDLVHLDPGWLIAGATATRLLRIPSVVVSIDDATASAILAKPQLRKILSVLLTGPNSRTIFANEATSQRCVDAGLVRPGRALVIAGDLPNERQRMLDVYAACLGHPPVTLTTS